MEERDSALRAFLEATLARGASDRFVADLLRANGWADKEIYKAFREHYEQVTGVPLPARREGGESAKDAFFYLVVFSTLASCCIAVVSLFFNLIDRWFPDPVVLRGGYSYPYQRLNLSFQIATLVVAFPVFLYLSRWINRSVAEEPRNRTSGVRKWLIYMALVIAAGVVIGDVVAVLASFLNGEVSARFLLKVIVVLVVAGGVFTYYLGEAATQPAPSEAKRRRTFAWVSTALVGAGPILGFVATGSPGSQRAFQADVQRARDLAEMARSVHNSPSVEPPRLSDPVTNSPYEYTRRSDYEYQLCAVFETDNRGEVNQRRNFWAHPAGRHCFQLDRRQLPLGDY